MDISFQQGRIAKARSSEAKSAGSVTDSRGLVKSWAKINLSTEEFSPLGRAFINEALGNLVKTRSIHKRRKCYSLSFKS